METTVKIFKSANELSHFFAQKMADDIEQFSSGKYYSMALSGGLTPRKVFEYLASQFRVRIEWQKVQVFWSDERCVDPENDESNYRMAKESLLNEISIPAKNIFRIHGEADPSMEADRYSDIIRQHVLTQNNIPQFDLIMLGLGDDGHIASIFPDNLALFESEKLMEVTENPYSKQKRITVTGNIINSARTVVFLVTGEPKAEMAARIIERMKGWDKLPASLVNPGEGELIWLMDEPAASKLDKAVDRNK